ncbi:restriction endonuclease subunit S [Enterococcus faecalis]|uniref:restriction endonuclease subunit S n=1 Tax=Enterococcus faecalis TaxID=1351 RepID=UPI000A1965A9|nr:restriction endonuclease subunit S [Enterococcus faecalis]MCU2215680.1 restriction endonuclease subunit S [Enterococcus faecalis]MCV3151385.1 restriction endonuclease subunit S [Enterococcus faecalis]MCV3172821.1 restriction endonuclease subunit S [Enterococcus faecalis]NSO78246.1 restriction endonuclease subunit S [Enterococcus faecalis]
MMSKKSPQLRFEGFTDDWEERKFFESIASTIDFRGRTPKKLGMDWSDSGYLALSALNVKNGYIDPLADAHYGDEKLYRKWMSGRELKKGQVLFTTEAPMGNVAQVPDDNGYILSQRTVAFETKEDMMTNDFLAVLLKSPLVFNNLSALSSGGTAKGVSQKSLKGLSITVPLDIDEQQKIGSFFKQLDNTIALHQRKLDLLKEQKKGYLQKMFPKNGAKVPELRFAGFVDDWEERKLGDISYKVKEKNKTGEFTETLTNSAEYGIINQRDFFDKDISNAKNLTGYYVVKNDDFVYNPRISNFAPVGPIKRNKLGRTGVMSPLYYVFRTHDIDKNYFEKYFDTVYWHRFMELNGDSGARADRFAIKDSVFVEMPIPYPTMDEQQKIGSFFQQLDNTITLHQLKLDLLKEQKKGFLQKMFA